jgi:hypothetical protein
MVFEKHPAKAKKGDPSGDRVISRRDRRGAQSTQSKAFERVARATGDPLQAPQHTHSSLRALRHLCDLCVK